MRSTIRYSWLIGLLCCFLTGCLSQYYTSDIYNISIPETFVNKTSPQPPLGMVYIPPGKLSYYNYIKGQGGSDTTSLDTTLHADYSLNGFFMDITETTNKQYRTFVDWVADSIAITNYIHDPDLFLYLYKRDSTGKKNLVQKRINWSVIAGSQPLWKSANVNIRSQLKGLVSYEKGEPVLVKKLLKFSYRHTYSDRPGHTTEIDDTVSVYPNTDVWRRDLPNSKSGEIHQFYFEHKQFNNYPVVGVNWRQANAYAYWRGLFAQTQISSRQLGSRFSIPTEMQYHYVAFTGMGTDEFEKIFVQKGRPGMKNFMLSANFKQSPGEYKPDNFIYTSPPKVYYPNKYGLYNILGNVAEWSLDSFTEPFKSFWDDINPMFLYEPKAKDGDYNKRKAIFGGSWDDPAYKLNPFFREYYLRDSSSSTLGFRCVLPVQDMLQEQVRIKRKPKKHKSS